MPKHEARNEIEPEAITNKVVIIVAIVLISTAAVLVTLAFDMHGRALLL